MLYYVIMDVPGITADGFTAADITFGTISHSKMLFQMNLLVNFSELFCCANPCWLLLDTSPVDLPNVDLRMLVIAPNIKTPILLLPYYSLFPLQLYFYLYVGPFFLLSTFTTSLSLPFTSSFLLLYSSSISVTFTLNISSPFFFHARQILLMFIAHFLLLIIVIL